jgi:8-oxo-dGTP diphosphatase
LVVHQGRLLLVKRAQAPWADCWDVPGGFCDDGEHPIETARREVREETGLDIAVRGFLGMWLDEYGPRKRTLNIYYHAALHGRGEFALDSAEILDAAWFAPAELPVNLAFPGHVPAALAAWEVAMSTGALDSALLDRPARAGVSMPSAGEPDGGARS